MWAFDLWSGNEPRGSGKGCCLKSGSPFYPRLARSSVTVPMNTSETLMQNHVAHVLVIDDDPDIRLLLNDLLRSAGLTVALAGDGGEAIKQSQTDPADLVITDIFMPTKDGLETILELRRRIPGLPVIAMSGRMIGRTMLCIARHLGAVATLQKPFTREDLLAAVEKAVPSKHALNQTTV